MKNVMGIINLVNETDQLEELTYNRCIASTPFGGRYRLIDFILSSLVNSGVQKVCMFTQEKYRSLMDHLGSGREWDLDRKQNGLTVLPPLFDDPDESKKGDLYYFYCHRDYFFRCNEEYVILSKSHMVCNIDFKPILQFHKEKEAQITVLYKEDKEELYSLTRQIKVNADQKVSSMQGYHTKQQSDPFSMEMLLMRKELFLDLVETSIAKGWKDFITDAVIKNLDLLSVYGYKYSGYLGIINTVQSYYKNSMDLLNASLFNQLFHQSHSIYTKTKDEAPAAYKSSASVLNSLVTNGCIIKGTVENSILFRGIEVGEGARLKNCIIMPNSVIQQNVNLENAILDKHVIVNMDQEIIGDPKMPFVAEKQKVI
ncbi:glucose-1-phosphate adenylyltransferase subunit GlgD [Chengkuizengella axinellae]|uniref:Glucose-1-phosphate adenylyltransferase subunit GlgD n=1 Tax=Chengkuizengella axinellae TaxID=3064388 RepID=A0ABT9IXR9_9BACL|nr:glucose-1-phosphate adenylyltransferase subunit GlgD [Chengkuizengella sp. 2205SS18-9]MDP5273917.1 glucose-1-phosphate adenylyltransferase subunit GlgD [Chengkuizengella sp. 2205SS18-9]